MRRIALATFFVGFAARLFVELTAVGKTPIEPFVQSGERCRFGARYANHSSSSELWKNSFVINSRTTYRSDINPIETWGYDDE